MLIHHNVPKMFRIIINFVKSIKKISLKNRKKLNFKDFILLKLQGSKVFRIFLELKLSLKNSALY